MRALRFALPAALLLALGACLGGSKTPPTLLTLTSQAAPVAISRSASAAETVTIEVPIAAKEIRQVRVAALEGPGQVTYIKGLQYVDTPDKLFQNLLSETVKRTTRRIVLDPKQAGLDPGVKVTGTLERFGYDASTGQVTVVYDAAMSTQGGTRVETRRFEANVPTDGTAASVGQAINGAANAVANQAAAWIGG